MSPAEESVTRTNLVWGTQQGCVCVLCFGLSRPAVRMTGNCECVPEERLEDSLSLSACVSLCLPPSKVSPSSSSSHPILFCLISSIHPLPILSLSHYSISPHHSPSRLAAIAFVSSAPLPSDLHTPYCLLIYSSLQSHPQLPDCLTAD